MTGPGPGKIRIDCEKVNIIKGKARYCIVPDVYIHVKGYSYARVTHLDIEYSNIEKILGIHIREIVPAFVKKFTNFIMLKSWKIFTTMEIYSKTLLELIPPGYEGGCVIGGKQDGIFVGFKKEILRILEEYCTKLGWPPR